MRLVNLTKTPLTLHDVHGTLVEVPPDARHVGVVALGEHRTAEDESGHVFSVNVQYVRDVKGLPAPEDGTLYIVLPEIAMALQQHRDDVVFPAAASEVRDAEGRLRSVTHLRRIVSKVSAPALVEDPRTTVPGGP